MMRKPGLRFGILLIILSVTGSILLPILSHVDLIARAGEDDTSPDSCWQNEFAVRGQPTEYPGGAGHFTVEPADTSRLGVVSYERTPHLLASFFDEAGVDWEYYDPWDTNNNAEPVIMLIVDDFQKPIFFYDSDNNTGQTGPSSTNAQWNSHGEFVFQVAKQILDASFATYGSSSTELLDSTGEFSYFEYGDKIKLIRVHVKEYRIDPGANPNDPMPPNPDDLMPATLKRAIEAFDDNNPHVVVNMSFAMLNCIVRVKVNGNEATFNVANVPPPPSELTSGFILPYGDRQWQAMSVNPIGGLQALNEGDIIEEIDCSTFSYSGLFAYLLHFDPNNYGCGTSTITTQTITETETCQPIIGFPEEDQGDECQADPICPENDDSENGLCPCILEFVCEFTGSQLGDPVDMAVPNTTCSKAEISLKIVGRSNEVCVRPLAMFTALTAPSVAQYLTLDIAQQIYGIENVTIEEIWLIQEMVNDQLSDQMLRLQPVGVLRQWLEEDLPRLVGQDRTAVTIAAAGNYDAVHSFYPGAWPQVISVSSAVDINEIDFDGITLQNIGIFRWPDSNSGELMAPGGWYMVPCQNPSEPACKPIYMTGTSFAAPLTSTVIGVSLSNPSCRGDYDNLADGPFDDVLFHEAICQ